MLLNRMSLEMGIPEPYLRQVVDSASKQYHIFEIDKRTGGKRVICHPSRVLKVLQRWLVMRVIGKWEIHSAATAYRRGCSIRQNALRHSATRYSVRLDFTDFFPSFNTLGIESFLSQQVAFEKPFDAGSINDFCDIVTRYGNVTIGAPSSPMLTNALMFAFDSEVAFICGERNLIYSRYADDIVVSSFENDQLDDIPWIVADIASKYPYAKLTLNSSKLQHLSRKRRRTITGLVVTPEGEVSIGRDRKREIKTLVHMFKHGSLDPQVENRLAGLISFANDIEPEFVASLYRKYGDDIVKSLHHPHRE